MSLRFDFSGVRAPQELWVEDPHQGRVPHFVTDALIKSLFYIGIGKVTDTNCGEVLRRLRVMEELEGPRMYHGDGSPRLFTIEDVTRHVGLTTNVTPVSKRAFDTGAKKERSKT